MGLKMFQNKLSQIAIAGVGELDYGALYRDKSITAPRDPYEMAADVIKIALDDAGMKKEDLDGILCVREIPRYEYLCYKIGFDKPRLVNILEVSGRQSGVALQYAAMAIATGMCHTVLVVYANIGRSSRYNYGGTGDGGDPYGLLCGMTSPGAQVAAMYNRYRYEFNVGEEYLGKLAVNNRYHASLNPNAVFRERYTLEDYMNSRYITEPLRLYDYCMINDGAVAMILTTVERAKDLKKPVVEMIGTSCCGDMASSYLKQDFFYEAIKKVSDDMFAQAGVSREDIDNLQIYDNFTPTILFSLDGLGYSAERGGTGDYIDRVGLTVGSSKRPVNTCGGHTSQSYMQGWNHQVECVRQLRHECGERQVPDSKLALYLCTSPIVTGHIFARR